MCVYFLCDFLRYIYIYIYKHAKSSSYLSKQLSTDAHSSFTLSLSL